MVMAGVLRRCKQASVFGVAALGASLGWNAARAAPITWERQGTFEACLETSLNEWLQRQAELVINEDPAAGRVDDAAVASWTADTLALCRARAGNADAGSENRFTSHMVRWRNHIYDLASSIRQKGMSD